MTRIQNVSRRSFLRNLAGAGGLVLGMRVLPESLRAARPGTAKDYNESVFQPNVWLAIDASGDVTIVTHRSEMGTGIRTSLPMVVADELEADWKRVLIKQAIGGEKYGSQNTDGSRSIRNFYETMRVAGATARKMLETAAAEEWGVDASECKAEKHHVVHPSGKKLGFGELAAAAAELEVPPEDSLEFKPKKDWRYVGKPVPIVDLENIVTGKAPFGLDVKMDGMKFASVEHCPVLGGKVKSLDSKEALKVPGVEKVVEIEAAEPPFGFKALGGVAVIGKNTWAVLQGRKKLKIEWDYGPHANFDSAAYRKQLEEAAAKPGKVVREQGDAEKAFSEAENVVEAAYYTPHLAHAPMEPPAALAKVTGGKCEAWAPTQNPQAVQDTVAAALGAGKKDVVCHVTLLGGGFGRKSKPDYVAEAAILSRKLGDVPVRVIWTREDDVHHDYFHAVAALRMKAALDESGKPKAWLQRTAFPTIPWTFDAKTAYGSAGELGLGFTDVPYEIANLRCEVGEAAPHVRIGWLRSVCNIYHAFAICSFADELAHKAGRDPKDYLLELIGKPRKIDLKGMGVDYPNYDMPLEKYPIDTGRLANVVKLVAEKSNWGRKLPKGRGLGIAAHRSFLTYVAAVVEVEVSKDGSVKVPRVDMAMDCGRYVNPDRVRSQMEGAAAFAASLALMGEITAKNGQIEQSNFQDYPVARIGEEPLETNVYIVENDEPPAGVGEVGVPPFTPALCNAIYAATGKRIRELPVNKHDLSWT